MSVRIVRGSIGLGLFFCAFAALPARAEIHVVTTTPTLASIVQRVAGEFVSSESLMRGPENPHNVIPKPSFVMKLRKADLFIHSGLDGEPWVPNLLRGARREALLPGGRANVDASQGIALLEVPQSGGLTRAQGDIHVYGNPHYLLDPLNGGIVAATLAERFAQLDAEHAELYRARAAQFATELETLTTALQARLGEIALCQVVTYHRTWTYFLARFGLRKLADVEPKPGISPGPRYVSTLENDMRTSHVGLVVSATFGDPRSSERLAKRVGGRHVVLAQEVGAVTDVDDYPTLFEHNVAALIEAFEATDAAGGCP